ncbi:zinc finger protein 420-like [Cheilinus undulatus]|uniref:zinc finger protein 420-like n=1 Tax=Cheilinus undulatus TaxID=241271 RepID=UPI001BD43978|nr:zinc finger protein 420-like [Cheilinus undulatus]
MSGLEDLRALFRRRLLAAMLRDLSSQSNDCECMEEPNRQRGLLKVILTPEIKLHRADTEQLMMRKQKSLPEQQERSSSLDQEEPPEPAGIEEVQEDRCGSLERELNQEEDDINKMTIIHDKPHESLNPLQSENTSVNSSECAPSLGRRVSQQSDLKQHSSVHSGEKPFSCLDCGKRFSYQSDLKRHSSVHTGVKPFGCLVCGKTFTRKSSVRRHSAVHSGGKSVK